MAHVGFGGREYQTLGESETAAADEANEANVEAEPAKAEADTGDASVGDAGAPETLDASPETSAYSTSGLLIASFSLMISIWVARSTLPVRAITTLTITLLPVVGMVPAVVAMVRRPRTWIVASVLIALHGATLAFALHAHFTLAR